MKEAMYYEKLEGKKVNCKLCPHYCTIDDGDVGTCRVRKNEGGTLYATTYGRISSSGYDDIEKKPLYHFYPGSTVYSVGSYGCNLACDFCQNHEIVYDDSYLEDIGMDEVVENAGKNDSIGIAFTYNEPSIWYEYILDVAKKTHEKGLKNILVTNGYINQEPLEELLPYIDAMNIDLKSMNDSFYDEVCNGSLEPVLETIETASKHVHVEVTNLLIEDKNSDPEEVEELAKKIASIDKKTPLHINRYSPAYKMDLPATSIDILLKSRDILTEHLDYVYIGNAFGMDSSTDCPNCRAKLIDRNMDKGEQLVGVEEGVCSNCMREVDIIYKKD